MGLEYLYIRVTIGTCANVLTVCVNTQVAGLVVGTKGIKINQIKSKSGAQVSKLTRSKANPVLRYRVK